MPAPVLSAKRRRLIALMDEEWRTVPEIMDAVNDAAPVSARKADLFSKAFLMRTIAHGGELDCVFDYRAAVSLEDRRRQGAEDGLWRLNRAGRLLRDEINRQGAGK